MEPNFKIDNVNTGIFILVTNYFSTNEVCNWHYESLKEALEDIDDKDIGIWKPKKIN